MLHFHMQSSIKLRILGGMELAHLHEETGTGNGTGTGIESLGNRLTIPEQCGGHTMWNPSNGAMDIHLHLGYVPQRLILLLGTELLGESAGIWSQCRVEAESSAKGLFWYLNYYHGVHSRTWTFHRVQLSS
ncbi:hypothetical protein FOWG_08852 [Fusarium oxysporum f. sp. lycopersici MN25]|jgi:hypothetical protein|uniref:Uncharacterized protein n=1 Tax=Fusarium oxysporum Fo47 TaxID=660027 RepID=W9L564_FUSOX|nr:hypothetical protein FOZG_00369 [Fusarium oxysporum Fo47]EWZ89104.1 hypothetical protein FOWG_08852 [Fusarium oxysporum f. sp. lycopersici MN25]